MCEICSKFTIKTPKRRHLRRSSVFIVNFEHILNHFSFVCIVDSEYVVFCWISANSEYGKIQTIMKFFCNLFCVVHLNGK